MRIRKKTPTGMRLRLTIVVLLTCSTIADAQNCIAPPGDLVSWWPFDDNANDNEGASHGIVVGAGSYDAGVVGQGFASVPGSLVLVNDNTSLDLTNFTMDAWVTVDVITSGVNMAIVWKGNSTGSSYTTPFALSISGTTDLSPEVNIEPGSVYATLGNNALTTRQHISTRQMGYTIPLGIPTHIAVTANETDFSLYIDGVLKATATRTVAPYTNDQPLQIGGVLNGDPLRFGYFLNGVIDELEIHSRALSDLEILAIVNAGSSGKCKCTPPPSDLVGWWPLDGNETNVANGTTGVRVGGSYASGEVRQGYRGNANSLIRDDNLIGVSFTNFTIDCWIQVDATTFDVNRAIIWKGNGTGSSFTTPFAVSISSTTQPGITGVPGSIFATISDGSNAQHIPTLAAIPKIGTGEFTHIAVTANGSEFRLYIDGTPLIATQTVDPTSAPTGNPLQIGGELSAVGSGYFLNGIVDEVEIHSRALSQGEIQAIVDAGGGGKCKRGYTPTGTSVAVALDVMDLSFSEVTAPGKTTATRTTVGPSSPAGFKVLSSALPVYYDVQTTATYTAPVTLCITYTEGAYSGLETDIHLFHYESGTWQDVTTSHDLVNNVICGSVNSLSPFILAEPSCMCNCHADPLCDATLSNVQDVVATINVAFRGAAAIPDPNSACPYETTDMNCDSFTSVIDVVKVVNVAFRGANAATEFCNPCP